MRSSYFQRVLSITRTGSTHWTILLFLTYAASCTKAKWYAGETIAGWCIKLAAPIKSFWEERIGLFKHLWVTSHVVMEKYDTRLQVDEIAMTTSFSFLV